MKLIVSGNAEEREGNIYAEYQQTLITLDDDDNEISRQIEYRTMETCIAPETTVSPEKPKQSFTPATDWGTLTTYNWHNFAFVSAPGNSQTLVKYDHPDNYYTHYPELWNLDWSYSLSAWQGGSYTILHASQYVVIQTESSASLWYWLFSTAVMLIGVYGAITIAALPLAIKLLAVTLAFLAVYAGLIWLWTQLIWKAEQGDAWSYTYLGTNGWLQMSHGLWRDIWYYAYYVG